MMYIELRVPSDGQLIYTGPIFWNSGNFYELLINTGIKAINFEMSQIIW